MSNSLRTILLISLSLAAWGANAHAATLGFEGDVKGPDGQLLQGAEVTVESGDAKRNEVKTDAQGRYVFRHLASGAYTLSVRAEGMASATVQNLKTGPGGLIRVDFEMKKQTGATQAAAPIKVKRRVYVKQTGSNLGRWVEMDEPEASAPGATGVKKSRPATTER